MSKKMNDALFEAVNNSDLEAIKAALDAGADINAKDMVDMTALTVAARDGKFDVVVFLVERGAEITSDTLMVANMSAYCPEFILKYLQLQQIKQVKPNVKYCSKVEANLLDGCYEGDLEKVRAAIEKGANVNIEDGNAQSALRWAARWNHLEVVKYLLENGADINLASYTGWTALLEAVADQNVEMVKFLLEAGADPDGEISNGNSFMFLANDTGNTEIIALMNDALAKKGGRAPG